MSDRVSSYSLEDFYTDCVALPGAAGAEARDILAAGATIIRADPSTTDHCRGELVSALRLAHGAPASLLSALTRFFNAQRESEPLDFQQVCERIYEADYYPVAEHLIFAFPYGERRARTILRACDEALSRSNANARVLDVGVGPGVIARRMTERHPGIELDVLDASSACLEYARLMLNSRRVAGAIRSDFRTYESAEPYDLIVASEVIEHVDDPTAAMIHLRSLLAAEGMIIVGVPVRLPMTMHLTVFSSIEDVSAMARNAGFVVNEGWLYPLYGDSVDVTLCLLAEQETAAMTQARREPPTDG